MIRTIVALVISAQAIGTAHATETAFAKDNRLSNTDRPAIKKLIKEDLVQAFSQAMQSTAKFSSILADDVKLKWPNKERRGKQAFIQTITEAFKEDGRLFLTAVENYKFLVTKCGLADDARRPVGLPKSVDVRAFSPSLLTPAFAQEHPGLMMPSVEVVREIQGKDFAANRYVVIAKFKHSWMQTGDEPYWYVDRWIIVRERGQLKIGEYEFTANPDEMPPHPTPLTKCP